MSQSSLCRLCICSCNEFQSLYDDNEQLNGVYDIAVKYFDDNLLNPIKEAAPKVICNDCWQNIYDFHKFQQLVINTQSRLEYKQPIVLLNKLNEDQLSNEKLTKQYCTQHPTPTSSYNSLIEINDKRCDQASKHTNGAITPQTAISVFDLAKKSPYICKLCNASFVEEYQLRTHVLIIHNKKNIRKYKCEMCSGSFREERNLRQHYRIRHKDYPLPKFVCNYCKNIYKTSTALDKHQNKEHVEHLNKQDADFIKKQTEAQNIHYDEFIKKRIGDLQCPICKVKLEKYTLLVSHFQSEHSEEQPYTICCNLRHIGRVDFCTHLLLHINSNAYQCDICEKCFKTYWSLNSHKRHIHFKELRSNNKRKFSSKITGSDKRRILDNDALISKAIGDLECVSCSKIFPTYTLLSLHFRLKHQGKQCYIICCRRKLNRRSNVVKHIREMHIGKTMISYKCLSCCASFLQDSQLRIHILNTHKNIKKQENKCVMCTATFTKECYLRAHYRSSHKEYPFSQYICNDCNFIFQTKTDLDQHKKNEHTKQSNEDINDLETKIDEQYTTDISHDLEKTKKNKDCTTDIRYEVFQSFIPSTDDEKGSTYHSYIPDTAHNAPQAQKTNLDDGFNPDNDLEATKSKLTTNASPTNNKDLEDELFLPTLNTIEAKTKLFDEFINKWKGDLQCPICNVVIEKYSLLNSHFKSEHSEEQPYTICCNLKQMNRNALCAHLRLHININAYSCEICNKRFKSSSTLNSHKRYVHFNVLRSKKSDVFSDVDCRYKPIMLENDVLISKTIGELKCDLCSKTFATYSLLALHFKLKHPSKKCHIICCGRKLDMKWIIVKHIRDMHVGNNIKLFKCQYCEASFLQSCKLEMHIQKMHNKVDKLEYKCDLCAATFARESYINSHYQRCHKGYPLPKYICKESSKSNNVLEHPKQIEEYTNDISDDDFQSLIALTDDEDSREEEITSHSYIAAATLINTEEQKTKQDVVEMDDQISFTTENDLEESQSQSTTNTSDRNKNSQEIEEFENYISDDDFECLIAVIDDEDSKEEETTSYSYIAATFINTQEQKTKLDVDEMDDQISITTENDLEVSQSELTTNTFDGNKNSQEIEDFANGISDDDFKSLIALTDDEDSREEETTSHSYIAATLINTQKQKTNLDVAKMDDQISITTETDLEASKSQLTTKTSAGNKGPQEDLRLKLVDTIEAKNIRYDEFIKKWKGDLQCPICNEVIEKYSLLNSHFKSKHLLELPYTICCNLKHNSRSLLCAHLKLHINPNAYQCDICKKRYKTLCQINSHKRHFHFNEPRSNQSESATVSGFANKRNILENDAFISKSIGDLKCVLCSEMFSTFKLLTLHFQVKHHGEECYIICCGRKFNMQSRIVQHIHEMHRGMVKNENKSK